VHELDEQRDGTLDDALRLGKQGLVLSSRGSTLREERACRGALALGTCEKVCSRSWEWSAINRERGAAFDVEARVREWAEERESWRGRQWREGGSRVAGLREDNRADCREGEAG